MWPNVTYTLHRVLYVYNIYFYDIICYLSPKNSWLRIVNVSRPIFIKNQITVRNILKWPKHSLHAVYNINLLSLLILKAFCLFKEKMYNMVNIHFNYNIGIIYIKSISLEHNYNNTFFTYIFLIRFNKI